MNKEMAGKKSRRVHPKKRSTRRKTLRRRKGKKGGAALNAWPVPNTDHSQSMKMPDKSFSRPVGTPEETSWFMPK
jgi:hypothetical protein